MGRLTKCMEFSKRFVAGRESFPYVSAIDWMASAWSKGRTEAHTLFSSWATQGIVVHVGSIDDDELYRLREDLA